MNFAEIGANARQHCIVSYYFYIFIVKKLVVDGLVGSELGCRNSLGFFYLLESVLDLRPPLPRPLPREGGGEKYRKLLPAGLGFCSPPPSAGEGLGERGMHTTVSGV